MAEYTAMGAVAVIEDTQDGYTRVLCQCGTVFRCSAFGDNVWLAGDGRLYPECPGCGRRSRWPRVEETDGESA